MSNNEMTKSDEECVKRFEDLDDEALARVARAGDQAARNALFLRHATLVRRLGSRARRLVRVANWTGWANVPLEPEDVDQQAFVLFCQALVLWRPGGSEPFMVYLRRKLPWLLLRHVHSVLVGRGGDPHLQATSFQGWHRDANARHVLDTVEDAEDHIAWDRQMETLPLALRGLVKLRYGDDLKSAQIAGLTGHNKRQVNRKLHEAISILRAGLEEDWEDV